MTMRKVVQQQQQNAFAVLQPQNYVALNRGDMFVPHGSVTPPIYDAIRATPWMGPMPAHAIPIVYSAPNANARIQSGVGVVTPASVV